MFSQNDSSAIYIASSESCEIKRFLRCQNKVEKQYIREQQSKEFHCCNQNMGFVNRMDQNVARYWYPNEKLLVFAVYLNGRCCYQVAWVLYGVNKDKGDESLTLLAFRRNVINVIFLEYSKEGRFSSSHLRIRNIPLDVCCDDTKYYQVQSEQRCLQNPFKHLRGRVFG